MAYKQIHASTLATSPKETIRGYIRNALINKSKRSYLEVDVMTELFAPDNDLLPSFVSKFRDAGGKFVPCKNQEQFQDYLSQLINSRNYTSLFCPVPDLQEVLQQIHVDYQTVLYNEPTDAALLYSDLLIARNGSMVFMQEYQLYPFIWNMATDLLVVSRVAHIRATLKETMQTKAGTNCNMYHIVTPSLPEKDKDGNLVYSPDNPCFFLFLVM
ncbi:MAG: hypothetical protein LBR51_04135 [Bacteroidales bacterium]|jgi:hypothetical protein|nr:hypothetical protein [Bacteroidales bacterium]